MRAAVFILTNTENGAIMRNRSENGIKGMLAVGGGSFDAIL